MKYKKVSKVSVELDNLDNQSEIGPQLERTGSQSNVGQKTSYRNVCLVTFLVIILSSCGIALAIVLFSTDEIEG